MGNELKIKITGGKLNIGKIDQSQVKNIDMSQMINIEYVLYEIIEEVEKSGKTQELKERIENEIGATGITKLKEKIDSILKSIKDKYFWAYPIVKDIFGA